MNKYNAENTEQIYEELCKINYGSSNVPIRSSNIMSTLNSYSLVNPYNSSESVRREYFELKRKLAGTGYHIGTISNGAHTKDFRRIYANELNHISDSEWDYTPVMYVYDCPAANSDCSFYALKDDFKLEEFHNASFEDHLCSCVWHATDKFNDENEDYQTRLKDTFAFFEVKAYSAFLLSAIREFKLGNLYTTNLFRYEIFRIENSKEIALNLNEISENCLSVKNKLVGKKREIADILYGESVIGKELQTFKPKVIFAASASWSYLTNYYLDKSDAPVIIKVPHPASYDSHSGRFLKNVYSIMCGLETVGIIDSDCIISKEADIWSKYKRILKLE